MIPKGNQRAGGQQLATHLLNEYDNDLVQVAEVRGAIAPDLHGAFAEWYAQSKATSCHKYLYSLSINPDHTQGPFNRKHYDDFISRTEKRLGLAGQPRAVVFHVKHGREHCHVVWSRIDIDKMRAVQLSHDRQKLRAVAQEYARDHNITLPPGMRNDRGKDRFPDHEKTENLAEKQQEERSGISKQQRREQITQIWRESADARSFIKALDAAGYVLARGDQRAYVLVDLYGEVHSLSRQLIGVKGKEMKQRLSTHPIEKLPAVLDAQDDARERRQALIAKEQEQERARKDAPATRQTMQERRDKLQRAQALRRGKLDSKREQLAERHTAERKALSDLQSARTADIVRDRATKQPKGVLALLSRITGFNAITAFRHARQDRQTEQTYREQKEALARRHAREMENFKHHDRGLSALEKRERRSLETAIRRETFRSIAAPGKTRASVPELTPAQAKARQLAQAFRAASAPRQPGQKSVELTRQQQAKIAEFKRAAAEMNAPAAKATKPPEKISPKFNQAAREVPAAPPDALRTKFNDKAEKTSPARSAQGAKKPAPPPREKPPADTGEGARLQEIKDNAADLTAAQRRALDLAKAFKDSAAPPRRKKERDQDGHGRTDTDRDKHYRAPAVDYSLRR